MSDLNEQLLPCPFCMGEARKSKTAVVHYVTCIGCNADGPFEKTEAEAIAAWNRRAPAAAPAPVATITEHDDLSLKVLHAIYHACQRGGSAEQLHAAIMPDVRAALAAAAPIVQPLGDERAKFEAWWEARPGKQFFEPMDKSFAYETWTARAALAASVVQAEPVAMVDEGDDGMFAEILPDRSVKVGQYLYAGPTTAAADEDAFVIQRMGELLARVAVAVRGQEPALRRWSYHDLPERVEKLVLEVELHRVKESDAATAADAKDAARYRWLRNEAWGGHVTSKGLPHVVEYLPGLMRGRVTELAEEALDAAIDAAIATSADEVKS